MILAGDDGSSFPLGAVHGILEYIIPRPNEDFPMPVTMKELGIDRLDPQDRLALVGEIWDSLAADLEKLPLTEAQKQEVDLRLAAHQANPEAAIPWEQVEAEALARLRK